MRILIVEDDFVSRRFLTALLSPYGECDVAVNGVEAITAFRAARSEGSPYDLVCLDIMMAGMDGHEVLRTMRAEEEAVGPRAMKEAKIVMTTALSAKEHVMGAFKGQCDGYVVKPIDKGKLLGLLRELELIK